MFTQDAHSLLDALAFETRLPAPLAPTGRGKPASEYPWYRERLERLGAAVERAP